MISSRLFSYGFTSLWDEVFSWEDERMIGFYWGIRLRLAIGENLDSDSLVAANDNDPFLSYFSTEMAGILVCINLIFSI